MCRFLLVDDNKNNIKVLESLLQNLSYETLSFQHPQVALDYLENNEVHIDLIFADLWMPVITGDKMTCAIKDKDGYEDVPAVAVTADKNCLTNNKFDLSIFDKVILKPVTISAIRNILEEFGFNPPKIAEQ